MTESHIKKLKGLIEKHQDIIVRVEENFLGHFFYSRDNSHDNLLESEDPYYSDYISSNSSLTELDGYFQATGMEFLEEDHQHHKDINDYYLPAFKYDLEAHSITLNKKALELLAEHEIDFPNSAYLDAEKKGADFARGNLVWNILKNKIILLYQKPSDKEDAEIISCTHNKLIQCFPGTNVGLGVDFVMMGLKNFVENLANSIVKDKVFYENNEIGTCYLGIPALKHLIDEGVAIKEALTKILPKKTMLLISPALSKESKAWAKKTLREIGRQSGGIDFVT